MLSFKTEKNGDAHQKQLAYEQQRLADINKYEADIIYSARYNDDEYEYRHVSLPDKLWKYLPNPPRLLTENEWRGLGVRQSHGWEHYMVHKPEPHVLLFKREKDYQLKYPLGAPPTAPALNAWRN
ncbi:transcription factor [Coemansia sp. RSA 988]|nr:transcription factor [Coemansia sp. RSA 988]